MTIGMFGSSRSSGSSKGSGGGAKTSSSAGKGSGATSGGGSSASTKAPPSTPGRKFSTYARRAGNLLGKGCCRTYENSHEMDPIGEATPWIAEIKRCAGAIFSSHRRSWGWAQIGYSDRGQFNRIPDVVAFFSKRNCIGLIQHPKSRSISFLTEF